MCTWHIEREESNGIYGMLKSDLLHKIVLEKRHEKVKMDLQILDSGKHTYTYQGVSWNKLSVLLMTALLSLYSKFWAHLMGK